MSASMKGMHKCLFFFTIVEVIFIGLTKPGNQHQDLDASKNNNIWITSEGSWEHTLIVQIMEAEEREYRRQLYFIVETAQSSIKTCTQVSIQDFLGRYVRT